MQGTLRENLGTMLYIGTWCRFVSKTFDAPIYLVGSSIKRPDFNDIDLRCVMPDDVYNLTFGGSKMRSHALAIIIGDWLANRLLLPIDFRIVPESTFDFDDDHELMGAD
jgi:hypothetical protein